MKKVLFIIAAALTLGLVSCNKENLRPAAAIGDEVEVTFEIASSIATRANDGNGFSLGKDATELTVAFYHHDGDYIEALSLAEGATTSSSGVTKAVKTSDLHWKVTTRFVKGEAYDLVFWAQAPGKEYYTLDLAGKKVTVKNTDVANDDLRDAFYALYETDKVQTAINETIYLRRPFAQINVLTTSEDILAAAASDIVFEKSAMVVKGAPTSMDLISGEVSGDADYTYSANAISEETLTLNGVEYYYIAMNYVLADVEKSLHDVNFDIYKEGQADILNSLSVVNVPIQRNYRTNIIGDIFTVNGTFEVIIDPIYETPDYDYTNTLQLALYKGGEVVLDKDEVIERQLVVPANSSVILNLNGHTISNTEDLWDESKDSWSLISVQGGSLTITGEGKLDAKENDCYALDVRDGGSLIIEGGEYIGNISAVYVYEGSADIRGGKFSLKQLSSGTGEAPYRYLINLYDAARVAGTASAVVSGGTFYMFDPGNNAAEGAGTNFLEEGYSTTLQDGWYSIDIARYELAPLVDAADAGSVLELENGIYNSGAWTRVMKDLTIKAKNPGKAIIDGKVTIELNKTIIVRDLVFQNDNPYTVTTHQFHNKTGATQLSSYTGSIEAYNCKFVSTTIYASINNAAHNCAEDHLLVQNCEFYSTAAEHRPILGYGNVTVTGCSFNDLTDDPGYCVQYYAGGADAPWSCSFTNNTVNSTSLPGGETAVGISISKSTTLNATSAVVFQIKGNSPLRYTWANKNGTVNFEEGVSMTADSDVSKEDWEFVVK